MYLKEEDVILILSVILQVTQCVFEGRCDTDTDSKFASDPACDTVALKSVGLLLPFLFYLVFSHK